ncbi:hypothetical protein [Pararhizobium sp.]|uniref:hypothetical protein n=1 Tax=Pararhizobium sp. TaxID=1977563 RepID=UPI003D111DDD
MVKSGLGRRNEIDNDIDAYAKQSLNRVYKFVWHLYRWEEEKKVDFLITTSTGIIAVPYFMDEIQAVRLIDKPLYPIDHLFVNNFRPEDFDKVGEPVEYLFIEPSPTQIALKKLNVDVAGNYTRFRVINTDTGADSVTVRFDGTYDKNGQTQVATETVTVAGGASTDLDERFSDVHIISKNQTVGNIQVVDRDETATVYALLPAWSNRIQYRRIRLMPLVDTSRSVYIQAVRKFEPVVNDNQTLMLPKAEDGIIDLLTAELFEYQEDYGRAQTERTKAGDKLTTAIKAETEKNKQDMRSVPSFGLFGNLGENTDHHVIDTQVTGYSQF